VLGLATLVPILLALGTTTPLYRPVRFVVYPLRYPRVPERLMPIACLAIAALVAFAISELACASLPRRVPRQALVITAIAAVLLLADLRVTTFRATAAGQGNAAYAALRSSPPGRLLEVPVFRPGIHYGGVYLYYDTQARRQRPEGYSTLAPVVTERIAKRLSAINCGDWSGHPERLLARLGVRDIVFHAGLFRDNPEAPDTAAFAWRGLVRQGYRPVASDGPVTLLASRGGGAEPPPPVTEPPRDAAVFCDGWSQNTGNGRTMATPHASLWVYNPQGADLRLYLSSGRPIDLQVGVDGGAADSYPVSKLAETRVPLGDEGWHLVTFDAPSGAKIRAVAYALG
jgi:hypothetical protein